MIIDLQTFVWSSIDQLGGETASRLRDRSPQRWGHLDASSAAHEEAMQCVDLALVHGFRSDLINAHVPNEFVAEFVARAPDRRIGVGGVDPLRDDAIDDVHKLVAMGLGAVNVSPSCQGFHPTNSAAMRVYELCIELSLPLFVCDMIPLPRNSIMEFGRPGMWDEVARTFPTLPIVIGSLGYPWIDEAMTLLSKHDNVFATIGGVGAKPWQLYNALLSAMSQDVCDRLLFASTFPHEIPARVIESLYSINMFSKASQLPTIPRPALRSIVERNCLEILGLAVDPIEQAIPRPAPSDDVGTASAPHIPPTHAVTVDVKGTQVS